MSGAKQLMKRGDREVAIYFKAECCRPGVQTQLNELLDFLLDPANPIDDPSRLKWCRALLAGGVNFEEFTKTVSGYDDATVCGLVWTTDFVAYRCRTCGLSPCMSLCSDCFHASNHTGHDFNMFRSQAGGACDCGDINVMKAIGFCPRHGPDRPKQSVPTGLLGVASIMMPRLIIRLIQHLRDQCPFESHGTYTVSMPDTEPLIELLQELTDMGAPMKAVITKAFTDTEIYHNFMSGGGRPTSLHQKSVDNYLAAVASLSSVPVPDEFRDIGDLQRPLTHTSLLDELFFWSVKYEFPQKIVTFMLSLLPNDDFKDEFTRAFVEHYGYITMALMNVIEKSRMANCIVHISVQLLSPPALATRMVCQHHLLHVILASLQHMINSALTDDTDLDYKKTGAVVDCSKQLLRDHSYWPLISDIINLFSHRNVALYFMADKTLLTYWANIMSYFQGMNMNVRELSQHVEYEPEYYYAAFSAELEICASTMWSLLTHLNDQSTVDHTRNVLTVFHTALSKWFAARRINRFTVPNPLHMSFHYPLHRYYTMFLHNAVTVQQLNVDDLLPPIGFLHQLMIHPLQLTVCYHEILTGLWVRNGHQIRGQAMTYVQSHFCNSTIDADIFLLQVIASRLDPDYFVHTVVDRFHVLHMLTFSGTAGNHTHKQRLLLTREQEIPMLENMLAFLATLLGCRTNIGLSPSEVAKQEMVTLLCVADRTHSRLMESMPETCGLAGHSKDYETTLREVADFKTPVFEAGGAIQQGKYVPKGNIWLSEYNPVHVMLRSMHRRDVQAALDRFTDFVKQQGLYRRPGNPWPPFRVPRPPHCAFTGLNKLLHCRTMHGLLFTLLYKCVNEKTFPESIIYYTAHLLELAVTVVNDDRGRKKILIDDKQVDRQFCSWFASDDILTNLTTVIAHVTVEETRLRADMSTDVAINLSPMSGQFDNDSEEEEFNDALPAPHTPATGVDEPMDDGSNTADQLALLPLVTDIDMADNTELALPDDTCQSTTATGRQALPQYRNQGVSVDTRPVIVNVPVNESMLTLLLQLYRRFSGSAVFRRSVASSQTAGEMTGTDGAAEPGVGSSSDDLRVGDGEFFVRKLLERASALSRDCADVIDTASQSHTSVASSTSAGNTSGGTAGANTASASCKHDVDDTEERRKRAKQRQERLMKEFASRQKKFMEKVVGTSTDIAGSDNNSSVSDVRQQFDCCICSQSTQSTPERLIGLVTLLQPTSFLGHRRRVRGPLHLPLSDSVSLHNVGNFTTEFNQRLTALRSYFDETSCLMSFNIGWQGGVFAQTCGHYLHLDCQKSYVTSLRSHIQSAQGLRLSEGEFWCPMCRQLSNTVLPILPDEYQRCTDTDRLTPDTEHSKIQHVTDVLLAAPHVQMSPEVSRVLESVMSDLTSSTIAAYRLVVSTNNTASPFSFVSSILRTNLELELDQKLSTSSSQPTAAAAATVYLKKPCISVLYNILNIHSKMLLHKPLAELWSQITGVTLGRDSTSQISIYYKEVPLLLTDVTALFIQLVLSMPLSMSKVAYQCIVQALFNVCVVQYAAVMSCKFTADEQLAWQLKGQETCAASRLEILISRVITLFSNSSVYDLETFDSQLPAICGDVWSPMSVEAACIDHVLPFVHICASLQFHLYGDELPSLCNQANSQLVFSALARYVGVAPSSGDTDSLSPADCMRWGHTNTATPLSVVDAWCRHLVQAKAAGPNKNRLLVLTNTVWYPAASCPYHCSMNISLSSTADASVQCATLSPSSPRCVSSVANLSATRANVVNEPILKSAFGTQWNVEVARRCTCSSTPHWFLSSVAYVLRCGVRFTWTHTVRRIESSNVVSHCT